MKALKLSVLLMIISLNPISAQLIEYQNSNIISGKQKPVQLALKMELNNNPPKKDFIGDNIFNAGLCSNKSTSYSIAGAAFFLVGLASAFIPNETIISNPLPIIFSAAGIVSFGFSIHYNYKSGKELQKAGELYYDRIEK
jgi:hypothetical protein